MLSDTLTEMLQERSSLSDTGITFLEQEDKEEFLSYKGLYEAALCGMAFLQSRGVKPKDELLIQTEDNKAFLITFWACVLGGFIPVPLKVGLTEEHRQKMFRIWPLLNNPRLICSGALLARLAGFSALNGVENSWTKIAGCWLDESLLLASRERGLPYSVSPADLAFIQFSSGSTGNPKGVMVTHRNLITNMRAIGAAASYKQGDSLLSWMPLSHDMGLIGFHLNPLFSGLPQYLMPTPLFVRRPALWLDIASRDKITVLCAPNFGYAYLLRHGNVEEDHSWDLSHVRLIYNGAEPISASLCRRFLTTLAKYGLAPGAMCPVYGLAEATLAVAISAPDDEMIEVLLDRRRLGVGDKVGPIPPGEHATSFVNVGRPVDDCQMRITDAEDIPVGEETVGHIQIKGVNVSAGYYNDNVATDQAVTADGWTRTGDLGFMMKEALYVTGRAKDIIFVNGQNYYPHDLERLACEIEGVELNKIAIAGYFNPAREKEEIVAFILHRSEPAAFLPILRAVKEELRLKGGVEIDRLIPVKEIPKTTSGKLQRYRLIEQWRNGDFSETEELLAGLMEAPSDLTPPAEEAINETEGRLLDIWGRVLGVSARSTRQDFFTAGGTSLKAAELSMMILKEWGVDISPVTFYEKRTVRDIAPLIASADKRGYTPIPVVPCQQQHPLSAAQLRIYYSRELDKDGVAYNIPVAFRIQGDLNVPLLEACIRQLVKRHESLRSAFFTKGQLSFQVWDQVDFVMEREECRAEELEEKLKEAVLPFALDKTPLFRFKLWKVNNLGFILLFDVHHIVADGISVALYMEDLMKLYSGDETRRTSLEYKDFVYWEIGQQTKPVQREYWMKRLQGGLPVLDLPTDYTRPAVFSGNGSRIALEPGVKTSRLRDFAAANNCTPHVLLFAVYVLLLHRYSAQDELVVGIPVAGRRHPDLQYIPGMFVNNLAIRVTICRNCSFREFLQRVKQQLTADQENGDFPFDEVVKLIRTKRDVARHPIFDTMFNYQNMTMPEATDQRIRLSRYDFDPGFAKYDLSLELFEDKDNISGSIEYATALFKQKTVWRMGVYFSDLLCRVLDNPDRVISDLFLTSTEQTGLKGPVAELSDKTVHGLFEEQAARAPQKIAIRYEDREISYGELNEQAGLLAGRLKELGVNQDAPVAIMLPRCPEMIISILAVLKAGGFYLPIDTGLPEERKKYMISDSGCRVILMGAGPESISIPKTAAKPSGIPAPDDLAYVIYTSGTSGRPKGVMVGQKSLANYICWAADHYVKGEDTVFPLFTSVSFDLTVTSIFTPLITGNAMVIYKEGELELPIEKIVAENMVDIIKLTPSHLKLLIQGSWMASGATSRVRRFIVGGENLPSDLAGKIDQRWNGKVEIFNEYGPTEATVGCMIHLFDPQFDGPSVPIGIPAAGTVIHLLDKDHKPVQDGARGEIHIAGECLAKGYWKQDALTAEKFIPDPFHPGKLMYRTGDLARLLPEGVIEYGGRSDEQVKINGNRIELAEIENCLNEFPGVGHALVIKRDNDQGQSLLYAYYTGGEIANQPALRDYLAARLPHYMIPAYFIPIDTIPLTINGKIDQGALPLPERTGQDRSTVLPRNKVETLSLEIWEDVLGEKGISITDNFFELGGDSIKAVQIASRLAERSVTVNVKDILTYHTIAQISPHVRSAAPPREYDQGAAAGEVPLNPIQSWFFELGLANVHHFNQSILLRLRVRTDAALWRTAFERLIMQHDALRLNYDPVRQSLFYNEKRLGEPFELMVLPGSPYDYFTAAGDWMCGFDIMGGLLLKAALFSGGEGGENGEGGQYLFITAHHLVIDAFSWRIVLEDLYLIYRGLETAGQIRLPGKTASLNIWGEEWVKHATLAGFEGADYWKKVKNTSFPIPLDLPVTVWMARDITSLQATALDKERTEFLLREAHHYYKTDVPVLLNTALAAVLKEWTGLDHLVIELENHGRHLEEIDVARTVGWFTTMYPVRLDWKEGSWPECVKAIKEQLQQVPGKGEGYGIREYGMGRSGGGSGLPAEVRFNYLGQFAKELNNDLFDYMPGFWGLDNDPRNKVTAKLEWIALVIEGELRFEIRYHCVAHKESTIRRLADSFINCLLQLLEQASIADDLRLTPADFGLMNMGDGELDALFG